MFRPGRIMPEQFRALGVPADQGRVAAAAKTVRLTAPAIHIQLKNLEENTRSQVVSREGRGGGVTLQGWVLLRTHEQIEVAITRALAGTE